MGVHVSEASEGAGEKWEGGEGWGKTSWPSDMRGADGYKGRAGG